MKFLVSLCTVLLTTVSVFAEEAAPVEGGLGSMIGSLAFPVMLIAVFYFMLIMPQRKKDKQTKAMVASLKMGDEIVTIGGIHGKIVRIKDETLVLESGAGTQKSFVRVDRAAVSRMVKEGSGKVKDATPIPGAEDENDGIESTEE